MLIKRMGGLGFAAIVSSLVTLAACGSPTSSSMASAGGTSGAAAGQANGGAVTGSGGATSSGAGSGAASSGASGDGGGGSSGAGGGSSPGFPIQPPKRHRIVADLQRTCAIGTTGVVCWGPDRNSQPASFMPLDGIPQSLVMGDDPSVCGFSPNGSVTCADWRGGTAFSKWLIDCLPKTPVLDVAIDRDPMGRLVWIASDGLHAQSLPGCSATPLPAGFGDAVRAQMEQEHLCALDAKGTVTCWDPLSASAVEPVVSDTFVQVVPNFHEACGVTVKGTVRCWDESGTEDVAQQDFPYFLSTGPNSPPVVQLASDGEDKLCALFNDGRVLCNQLFNHGSVDEGFQLPPGEQVVEIAVGSDHVCGIRADDTVLCVPYGCSNCDALNAPPAGFKAAP